MDSTPEHKINATSTARHPTCGYEEVNSFWKQNEIQQMMHGFGDCCEPLVESARIIEDIVLRQMRSIVEEACKVSERRDSSIVDTEDFIFLLRKDIVKLRRLITYLDLKEFKSSIYKVASSEVSDLLPDIKHIDEHKQTKRPWENFLVALDATGELNSDKPTVDQVKYSRCVRAEMMSKNLDEARYIEYSKARNVSFANRHRHKFSDWVIPNDLTTSLKIISECHSDEKVLPFSLNESNPLLHNETSQDASKSMMTQEIHSEEEESQ